MIQTTTGLQMKRVIILGFMACGKTTVGKELARQLNAEFIDLDCFFTQQQGRSPAEMIAGDGESAFRHVETTALNELLTSSEARVVALGGGTWTIPENRTLIALHDGVTVWLDVPFDVCWQRIVNGSETVRPLAASRDAALNRYETRRADYALAEHRIICTEADDQETIAVQILPLC